MSAAGHFLKGKTMSLWDSVSTSSTTNDTIATQQMDDIEYQIHGHDMQLVELVLDSQEAAIGEAGSMLYLEDGIVMETSVLYPVIAVERRQFSFYIISIVYGTVCIAWHNCKNAGKRALAAVGVADAHSH